MQLVLYIPLDLMVNNVVCSSFSLDKQHVVLNVIGIVHYTGNLFSFKTNKPKRFRFKAGEFVMIGLVINSRPVFRAYSICSASWQRALEFYSVKVPNGPFTSFLQKLTPKSAIIMKVKATGTLTLSSLKPGKRLFLLCTGTGVAPFVSVMFEPEAYESYDEVIVVMVCRLVCELQFLLNKCRQLVRNARLSALIKNKLRVYTSVTRDSYPFVGRITELITSGALVDDLNLSALTQLDRFMVCGSQAMIADTTLALKALGYKEGSVNSPQAFAYEKAFVG
ncbi:MAG: Ferredoxin--NADP reductase [Candidatus Hodgkinia cicadicola]|nr:MAG: Ferredoxin--NADP reductase [Candidatus Hodgkinia cicadicola]